MEAINPYATPASQVEDISTTGGIWRKEKLLVMQKGAALPARCIYCNKATGLRNNRRILYLNIWLRVLILLLFLAFNILALIPTAIIILVFRKSAKIRIPICQEHRDKRLAPTLVTVTVLLMSIGSGFLSVTSTGYREVYLISSVGLFVLAIVRGQLLRPKKIDAKVMLLKGARPPFLDCLPEYADR